MNDDNLDLIKDYARECYRILKQDTALYMFCSSKTIDIFIPILRDVGFTIKNIIVWDKCTRTMGDLTAQFGQSYEFIILCNKGRKCFNGKRLDDIWRFPRVTGSQQVHQNQKPIELIRQCIEKHSDPGDLVFDGFMGSGTTAIAAIETGRHYLGYELDPDYYKVCTRRILDKELEEV